MDRCLPRVVEPMPRNIIKKSASMQPATASEPGFQGSTTSSDGEASECRGQEYWKTTMPLTEYEESLSNGPAPRVVYSE